MNWKSIKLATDKRTLKSLSMSIVEAGSQVQSQRSWHVATRLLDNAFTVSMTQIYKITN